MTGSTAPVVAPRSVTSPLPSPTEEQEEQEAFPAPSPRKRLMSPPPQASAAAGPSASENGAAAPAEETATPSPKDDAVEFRQQDSAEPAEGDSTHPSAGDSVEHSVNDTAESSKGDSRTVPVDDSISISHSVDSTNELSKDDSTTVAVDDLTNHPAEDSTIPSAEEVATPSKADEDAQPSTLPDDPSRVMSPEVGALPHGLPHHHHQRTQSMDSTSSGHSSGSGSGSGSSAFNNAGRRRVTVKPLAEPEDQDTPAFIRPTNETPIEKEIRLAREREAELAREKALRLGITTPTAAEQTIINNNNTTVKTVVNNNNNNNVEVAENKESVRNATNRIQQEISRANEREQEHRHSKEGPQRFSTPEFPGRVKLKKAVSTSQLAVLASEQSPAARPPLRRLGSTTPQPQPQPQPQSAPTSRAPLGRSVSAMSPAGSPTLPSLSLVTPRRYAPHPSQKGVMQRFLASRGKVNPVGLVSNGVSSGSGSVSLPPVLPLSPLSPMSPSAPMSPVQVPLSPASTAKMSALVDTNREADREEPAPAPVRRGYTSAEDKIQEELKEMRRREEELRLQRARTFARSQPNLLSLLDDVDGPDSTTLKESSPVIDKLPAMAALRSALSNPNLLDEDSNHNGVDSFNEKKNLGPRKKNSLIAEWENRIQQLNEH
ncbi:Mitotic interactor and substrate of PLK1 [Frankliniella fusca]|uniref:Mitotic interactor and substrate of PLK1 n=1 Tax=Frankliniella fusca TaxID=407009 RepID=A0AAE1I2Y3_9NEOP|nr:Mitotic interactor and substrate of PLK1 [Frankliniella fusca]